MIKSVPPQVDEDDDPTTWIISEVGKPIKTRRNNIPDERKSVDLAPHVDSLRQLIHKAEWKFQQEKDDWEPRLAGVKPRLEDNWKNQPDLGPEHEYGEDSGVGFEDFDWKQVYKEMFAKKGAGRPPSNQAKENAPPPVYLHSVISLVQDWWEHHVGEPFKPKFGGAPYDFEEFNAPARLLHLIVQECDPRYVLANTANLPRTLRDERKKPSKKNRP